MNPGPRADGFASDAALWRRAVEALALFVVICADDGTILDGGAEATGALGFPQSAGVRLWDAAGWAGDGQVSTLQEAFERARSGEATRVELPFGEDGAGQRVIEVSIVPARAAAADEPVVIVAGVDVTDRASETAALAAAGRREQVARQEAEAMAALSGSLAASLDIEGIGRAVARYAAAVGSAAFTNFGTVDRTGAFLRLFHGENLPTDVEDRWPSVPIDDTSPLGAAVRTGQLQWIENPADMRSRFPAGASDAERAGLRSLAAVPVRASGRVAAGIGFAWSSETAADPALVGALELAAQICGQAVERAERRARQLSEARELQVRLLPRVLVDIPDLDIAARYLPAASDTALGGDWYDVLRLDGGRVALIVGDVVGHGVRAAAAMGQLRSAIQALAPAAPGPGALLEQLDLFAAGVDGATMATVAIAYMDLPGRELCYSLAGHLPPLLLVDGRVVRLDRARGAPLNIRAGRARAESSVHFDEGNSLLLYTDGLVERPGEDLDDGIDRLGERLGALLSWQDGTSVAHIETVCDRLVDLASVGQVQNDDIAALCVRFAPQSTDRLRLRVPATTAQLATLRQRLRSWLAERGVAGEDVDDLLVITGEAAANSIEHGYFEEWAAGEVALEVELRGPLVFCRVRDFGRWRYPPARGDRGRGLKLIRALAERVEVLRGLQGTTVIIDYRCRAAQHSGR